MNTNNGNEDVVVINLKDMVLLFLKRLWAILLVAAVVGGAGLFWEKYTYEERYTSTVEAILFSEGGSSSLSATVSYFQIMEFMINNCEYVLTSDEVVGSVLRDLLEGDSDVLKSLGVPADEDTGISMLPTRYKDVILRMGTDGVKRAVSISSVSGSHVLYVSVTTESPEVSQILANALCSRGAEMMEQIYGLDPIFVISEGRLPHSPSNSVSVTKPLAMAFFAGLALYGLFVLIKISDNKINTTEDVEKYLGLSVLGEIPVSSSKTRKKGYYYR